MHRARPYSSTEGYKIFDDGMFFLRDPDKIWRIFSLLSFFFFFGGGGGGGNVGVEVRGGGGGGYFCVWLDSPLPFPAIYGYGSERW